MQENGRRQLVDVDTILFPTYRVVQTLRRLRNFPFLTAILGSKRFVRVSENTMAFLFNKIANITYTPLSVTTWRGVLCFTSKNMVKSCFLSFLMMISRCHLLYCSLKVHAHQNPHCFCVQSNGFILMFCHPLLVFYCRVFVAR